MFTLLMTNLQLFAALLLLFTGSYAANTLLGTFYNITLLKEMFERERFIQGLLRGGVLVIGLALVICIISLLPGILEVAGLTQLLSIVEDLTLLSVAGLIVSATVKYAKGAIQKLYRIIMGEEAPEEVKEIDPEEEETEGIEGSEG